jgi:hypothetical protein
MEAKATYIVNVIVKGIASDNANAQVNAKKIVKGKENALGKGNGKVKENRGGKPVFQYQNNHPCL